MPVRTHYDNLHIPQNADADTIRRAYRRLSKQYHPDLNPDQDAHRIMQLINQAYEVLSDPVKRAEHDRWIAAQNRPAPSFTVHIRPQTTYTASGTPAAAPPTVAVARKRPAALWWLIGITLLIVLLGWQIAQPLAAKYTRLPAVSASAPTGAPETSGNPTTAVAADNGYIRPYAAPNGNPWPDQSGYIAGYTQTYGNGNRRLYIDNVRNPSDVFAELYAEGHPQPLRTFFINERGHLILDRLDAGSYHLRYRQLDDGESLKSETIMLHTAREATLYLQRGNPPKH